jgi:hypothetical protein
MVRTACFIALVFGLFLSVAAGGSALADIATPERKGHAPRRPSPAKSQCSGDDFVPEATKIQPERRLPGGVRALVPTPKFVSLHGILVYELGNRTATSKSMILVWLLVQKSARRARGNNDADF